MGETIITFVLELRVTINKKEVVNEISENKWCYK